MLTPPLTLAKKLIPISIFIFFCFPSKIMKHIKSFLVVAVQPNIENVFISNRSFCSRNYLKNTHMFCPTSMTIPFHTCVPTHLVQKNKIPWHCNIDIKFTSKGFLFLNTLACFIHPQPSKSRKSVLWYLCHLEFFNFIL